MPAPRCSIFRQSWKRCSRSAIGSRSWLTAVRGSGISCRGRPCCRSGSGCPGAQHERADFLVADCSAATSSPGGFPPATWRPIGCTDFARRLLSMLCAGALVAISGHDPIAAFVALVTGAVGSPHQIGAALNRTTPYLLAGGGVAMCFRAGIINIGAEGQIAVGGMGTAAACSPLAQRLSLGAAVAALLGGAARVPCGQGLPQRSTLAGGCMKCWRRCC